MKGIVANEFEYHQPVLAQEVIQYLVTDPAGRYIDCTLGGGGHSQLILNKLNDQGSLKGFDRDPEAVNWCREKFKDDERMEIISGKFSGLKDLPDTVKVDGVLMDLGVSSHQLNSDERGFSFRENVPLDMRMNNAQGLTAYEYLMQKGPGEIEKAFSQNSDLPRAKTLAREIKNLEGEFKDSQWLAKALDKVYPKGVVNKNQMMARIYQAIRIEVNDEKKEVQKGIAGAIKALKNKGRLLVISFHSVEDRWVKKELNQYETACICPREFPVCNCGGNHQSLKKLVKKPICPKPSEIAGNSRARSAKLRVMEKIQS